MRHQWTCNCCGKQFDELPMSFALQSPDPWFALNEHERGPLSAITGNLCIIDGTQFFILGCIEIPVIGADKPFVWNVWVSLSQKSYGRIGDLWETETRENEPPFFGWLSNAIPIYPNTFALKTSVQLRNDDLRPAITLEPTDHPLAIEQRNGISLARVEEIAALAQASH